jgi:hypothetical protein
MTKYQILRQIAEYRIACKQDGVSIEDRPSSHRLVQGWNAIWILINRVKNGHYDRKNEILYGTVFICDNKAFEPIDHSNHLPASPFSPYR